MIDLGRVRVSGEAGLACGPAGDEATDIVREDVQDQEDEEEEVLVQSVSLSVAKAKKGFEEESSSSSTVNTNMFRAMAPAEAACACLRCGKTVYPTDKIGPLKDFTFFHSGCFRCVECSSKLTLRTYLNNQHSQVDKEVYCSQHVPKIGPGRFDKDSMGIKSAMNAPKSAPYINEQIRPGGKATFDADALAIRAARLSTGSNSAPHGHGHAPLNEQDVIQSSSHPNAKNWTKIDSSALHIRHALNATEVQRKYSKPREQPIEEYLVRERIVCTM